MQKMKEMNTDLYEAISTLKHQCKMVDSCAQCPLSFEHENGDIECLLILCRPCNLAIEERYYVGKGVFSA